MIARARYAAAAFLAAGCVFNPLSNSVVSDRTTEVHFNGDTQPEVGLNMTVAFESPRGGFIDLKTVPVPSHGSWSMTVDVPEVAWWKPPCNFATFRVRDSQGQVQIGSDRECLEDPRNAGFSCPAALILLQKPLTYTGDLNLIGQAQADAYKCYTTINGNLTITGGATQVSPDFYAPGLAFSLPRLGQISGNLSVDGDRTELVNLPELTSVGGSLHVTLNRFGTQTGMTFGQATNTLNAPELVSVGGGVDLLDANFAQGGATKNYDFGMDGLTTVGAGVTMHNPVFPANVHGLRGLTSIPGDLVFDFGVSDMNNGDIPATDIHEGLLPLLTTVGGNAQLTLPPNANAALGLLATVGGTLTVQPAANFTSLKPAVMPQLSSVGGDLVLQNVRLQCNPTGNYLTSLQSVAGTLHLLDNSQFHEAFGATGVQHLSLGGLEMSATGSTLIPLFNDAAVLGAGPVSFQNNASLCQCQIDAFTALLTANGWSGAPVSSGNGGAVVCAPCPAPSCP